MDFTRHPTQFQMQLGASVRTWSKRGKLSGDWILFHRKKKLSQLELVFWTQNGPTVINENELEVNFRDKTRGGLNVDNVLGKHWCITLHYSLRLI